MEILITKYLSTRSEAAYNEAYRKFIRTRRASIASDAKKMRVPFEDMQALYEDCWMGAIEDAESGVPILNFNAYIKTAIESRKCNLERDRKRPRRDYRRERLESGMPLDGEKSDESFFEFADEYNLENDVISRIQRKREQLALLSALVENSDVITKKLLQAAREIHHKGGKINAYTLGKAIGVTDKVITLRFKRLQTTFDNLGYGNIRDYLTA
ncbi:hypothetical protein [Aneurinibacillus aneurinilyticus]|uniref:Uncharacterized protein n=1 Tax=Aneurinibacillus aneurinilyticus TaxID=1391 RepID=A0A848CWB4_ANEAE|nr:hypothetical protein [Aneurinibacillus aneurinilyticus]NMF00044.1 hypothetical protein [Aneurinibacillus aneurinilyticus]